MSRPLHLVFEDRAALCRALEGDLAKGGAFVPCEDAPPLQARVVIAVELAFCRERVLLDAEVVHVVAPEQAPSPDAVGVGVQFLESAEELSARFRPLVGEDAAAEAPTGPAPSAPPDAAPPQAPLEPAPDFLADGDLFGDDEPEPGLSFADPSLSDGELAALLDGDDAGGGALELDVAPGASAAEAEGDPKPLLEPDSRDLDPGAATRAAAGPSPGDPEHDPSELVLDAGDDDVLELGEPGTGHRVRRGD